MSFLYHFVCFIVCVCLFLIVHAAFVRIKSMTRMTIIPDVQSNPETHPITQTLTVGQISRDGRCPEETSDSSGSSSGSSSGGTQSR